MNPIYIKPSFQKAKWLWLLAYSLFLLGNAGCNGDGNWKDEGINPGIRKAIDRQNQVLLHAILYRKPRELERLFSDSLLRFRKNIPDMISPAFLKTIIDRPFVQQHMLQVNGKPGSEFILDSDPASEWSFLIRFKSHVQENVAVVGYFKDSLQSIGMLALWSRYDGQWKLDGLRFGPYQLLGQDAMYWLQKAQAEFDRDDVVDAFIHLSFSQQLLKPFDEFFRFKGQPHVGEFERQLKSDMDRRLKLPMEITTLDERPTLLQVTGYVTEGSCRPLFTYETRRALTDTSVLSMECDSVHKEMCQLFHGVDEQNKTLIYRACRRIVLPSGGRDSFIYVQMERANKHYYWYNNQ